MKAAIVLISVAALLAVCNADTVRLHPFLGAVSLSFYAKIKECAINAVQSMICSLCASAVSCRRKHMLARPFVGFKPKPRPRSACVRAPAVNFERSGVHERRFFLPAIVRP